MSTVTARRPLRQLCPQPRLLRRLQAAPASSRPRPRRTEWCLTATPSTWFKTATAATTSPPAMTSLWTTSTSGIQRSMTALSCGRTIMFGESFLSSSRADYVIWVPRAPIANHRPCDSVGITESSSTSYSATPSATASSTAATATATSNVSPDGTCGEDYSEYTCEGSQFGDCCSQYGYCGSTSDYCGTGCQTSFGTCS